MQRFVLPAAAYYLFVISTMLFFRVQSDLRNHQAIVTPRLYDCLMVTQITLRLASPIYYSVPGPCAGPPRPGPPRPIQGPLARPSGLAP